MSVLRQDIRLCICPTTRLIDMQVRKGINNKNQNNEKAAYYFCLFEVLSLKSPEHAGKLAHVQSHTMHSYKSSESFPGFLAFCSFLQ